MASETQVIIVGAGSAGCILAARLVMQQGLNVTLIEAGGSDLRAEIIMPIGYGMSFFNRRTNWRYQSEPQPQLDNRRIYIPRGKVVGGSGSINAMVYARGKPGDFEDWQQAGGIGWDQAAQLFDRLEGNHLNSLAGSTNDLTAENRIVVADVSHQHHPLTDTLLRAASTAGIPLIEDLNTTCQHGIGHYRQTTHQGRRWSSANAFLRPAMKTGRLKLVTKAMVSRILFKGKTATAIIYSSHGRQHELAASHGVILAGGAINTPQLMMLSGLAAPDLLEAHGIAPVAGSLPHSMHHVGKHLQDHLGLDYRFATPHASLYRDLGTLAGRVRAGTAYLFGRRGPLALSVNQGGGFISWQNPGDRANLQLYLNPISYSVQEKNRRRLMRPDPFDGFSLGFQPCRPTSRGSIRLASTDAAAPPLIDPGYLADSSDWHDVEAGFGMIAALCRAPAMQALIRQPLTIDPASASKHDLIADFRARATTIHHFCGSCRLSRLPQDGVVRPDFRVHGMENLYIADASVFPNITSGNTNAPVMMNALHAAQQIMPQLAASITGRG